MKKADYPYGLTVKELKEYLEKIPEVDEVTGHPNQVWIETGHGLSSIVRQICPLSRSNILLTHEEFL